MKALYLTFLAILMQPLLLSGQVFQYQFNEGIGTRAASSGATTDPLTLRDAIGTPTTALWGAPGSGLSSSGTDRALDLTGAGGMGTGFTGPSAFLTSLSPVPALNQFTISGWFMPSTTDLRRANLISIENGSDSLRVIGLSGGPADARNRLRLIMDDGDSLSEVDASGDFESQWSTPNAWAFFAISYTGQDVTFYSGNLTAPVTLSLSSTAKSVEFPLGAASIWLGATSSSTDPFQGYLDDVRLYDSALSLSQVEQVRLSAVPEPGPVALLVLGLLVFIVWLKVAAPRRCSARRRATAVAIGASRAPGR